LKKDFVMPVLALALICLIMSVTLTACNGITQPVIEKAAKERAENARREIIPNAGEFVLMEVDDLPKTITEVYRTTNNSGFIFMIKTYGYEGEIRLICGIDPDGKIIRSTVLAHTETQGLGTLVFDREHEYMGKDKNLDGIDAISGATITSNAYINGIRDAFKVFEIVKGAQL